MNVRWMGKGLAVLLSICPALVRAQNVVINEIHYHPLEAAPDPNGDAEFVELYNPGPSPVNISGWTLSGFISPPFTFPPSTTLPSGGYVVVARNASLLQTISGFSTPYQWSAGSLANSTESVVLADSVAAVIDIVTYTDEAPWPAQADGNGPSLELLHPDFPNDLAQAWRSSNTTHGTPGAPNSVFSSNPVIVSESPPRASLVASLPSVSITFAEPVVNVTAARLTVNGSAATSVTGSGVGPYVFSGYAAPAGPTASIVVSSGSIQDSSGNPFAGDAWSYSTNLPKVVINEIHYHPADPNADAEFVELFNADSVSVNISNWQLGGFASIPFSFPPNTTLPAGGFVVVAKNPSLLASIISVPAAMYQWPDGSLANSSEPVEIRNSSGVLVDTVTYADSSPWPGQADGDGPSLELIHPNFDNSLASAWRESVSAMGTPGSQNSRFSSNPIVLAVSPERGAVTTNLPSISVTFSEPVTGVTAAALQVNGSPATNVSGTGAGPYVFTGYAAPAGGAVNVTLSGGAIQDLSGNAFAGDTWGYVSNLAEVVINELHYHPADSAVPAGQDAERLQFIELYNPGASSVNLLDWEFSAGLTYTFPAVNIPAGGYLLVAADGPYLQSQLGGLIPPGTTVLTWTDGNLSNSGEEIELSDSLGNVIDRVEYADGGEWPSNADGGGPSLELINPSLPNEVPGAWRASLADNGTPGFQNGVFDAAPAPLILAPIHTPSIPAGNSPVFITATVIDDGVAPPAVAVHYRVDAASPGSYATANMFDDGAHGDGDAGDNVYGVSLVGLPGGSQYDFFLTADDGTSVATYPSNHESANPACSLLGCQTDIAPDCFVCQRLLCKFSNETQPTDFPVYHLLITEVDRQRQQSLACNTSSTAFDPCKTEFDATFIDDTGKVFYNVTERYRGQSSITLNPKSYRVDFPSSNRLETPLGFPVRKLVLNANQPMRQKIGFDMFRAAGVRASRAEFVRLRITGTNYDQVSMPSTGFNGLYICVEEVDDDFLDSQDGGVVPDRGLSSSGNLYRGENTARFDWRGTNPNSYRVNQWGRNGYSKENNETDDNWTDLITLLNAMNNSTPQNYATAVANLIHEDEWALFFAIHNIFANKEGGIYLESGDDYYLYFNPPGHAAGYNAIFIPWDTDSILRDANTTTIWRTGDNPNTNIGTIRDFLRHNAFAPIFVKAYSDLINTGPLSIASFNAYIDSLPNQAFFSSGGTATVPLTKAQFKAWHQTRVNFINNEILDQLTLTGVPASPYMSQNPVITIGGQLNQAGTHNVLVNGQAANFSVYAGTWSYDLTLNPGNNPITVQALNRAGAVMQSVSDSVYYDPFSALPGLRLTVPSRMVDSKTLTLRADILDSSGEINWHNCNQLGTVSVTRVSDGTPVPTTITVFETMAAGAGAGTPPANSIRFYNGVGSVSLRLNSGASTPPGNILVTVTVGPYSAARVVEVLDGESPGLYHNLSGTLTGDVLNWGPEDGVIRLTGDVTVSNGNTLNIAPGTLIMVDSGPPNSGTAIFATGGGSVSAIGEQTNPIFFFPTQGAAAMTLPQNAQNNNASWRGIYHHSSGSSVYEHVLFTGAGNGIVVQHPRPPVLRFSDSHQMMMRNCVLADCPGMGMTVLNGSTGSFTIQDSLFSRLGFGGEFLGSGCSLLVEDCWFTRIGRAPEPLNLDGDILHVDRPGNTFVIRRSILTDCGDDLIDHSTGARPVVENCILYDARDKVVSLDGSGGGNITMTNCLAFKAPGGIRCAGAPAFLTNCTLGPNTHITGQGCAGTSIQKSILWTSSADVCCGDVDYTIVGNPADLGCGNGNASIDPMFVDVLCNLDIDAASFAQSAGPGGTRIGWLGFPGPSVECFANADCDDGEPCTSDQCNAGTCEYTSLSDAMVNIQATPAQLDCVGTPVTLDAGAGFASYFWTPDGQTTRTIQVSDPGIYSVTVTDGDGCSGFDSIELVSSAAAACVITAPPAICEASSGNEAEVPNAGAGATYAWTVQGGTIQSGQGTRMITFAPTSADNVTIEVEVTVGICSCESSLPVQVIPHGCGDMNGDSLRDGNDIRLFIDAILDPHAQSVTKLCAADMDLNGALDLDDASLFVNCLLTQACSCAP